MSAEGIVWKTTGAQSLSLKMALQQKGWGAIGNLNTSTKHSVASKINGVQLKKERSCEIDGSSVVDDTTVRPAVADAAKMAMETMNTKANFIGDAFSDFTAIV